ncbi:MAG TPA: agmatinase [Chloroflexota bacterium]|nr:agmatinase [Chloroflexota bacterium]
MLQSCVQPDPSPRSDLPDGHRVPRFAGINTFARLPHTQDLRDVDVAVVGVPFDGGATFRPGARFGPQKIREMSVLLRPFNPALGVEPFAEFRVVDWGDAVCSPISMEDSFRAIERAIEAVVSADAFPLVLGGDHSISLPVLRALAKRHGPLGLVHFDAHPDTWDVHFGRKYSHATSFRRAIEEGLVDGSRYVQVGIRGSLPKATDLDDARALGVTVLSADDVLEMGLDTALTGIRQVASGRVYVTLDIDVVDPAFAPGTGTPEVGGFSAREIVRLVRGLGPIEAVGCDLVEVAPPYDHGEITAVLAANLAYEMLSTRVRRWRPKGAQAALAEARDGRAGK